MPPVLVHLRMIGGSLLHGWMDGLASLLAWAIKHGGTNWDTQLCGGKGEKKVLFHINSLCMVIKETC